VKPIFRISIAVTLGFLSTNVLLRSQAPDSRSLPLAALVSPPAFSTLPITDVRWETTQLLRKKAGEFKLSDVASQEDTVTPPEKRPDLLILERFVVTRRPAEQISVPPPVTGVQHFFETGTFASHVGKKVTTRFWMHPWKGLMLSFEF
jgi:hypothetical protein